MSFKYAIALTGSIATGKSSVAKFFSSSGFSIIDADKITHKILNQESKNIGKMFGSGVIIDNDFEKEYIDRKALGAIVFKDKVKRKQLEALLHPLIFNEIVRLSDEKDKEKKPYIVDIPLFFESNRYPIARVLVVYTTKEKQLKRLMQRDGYNEQESLRRIDIQIPVEKKRKMATYLIDNSTDLAHLEDECNRVREEILGEFK